MSDYTMQIIDRDGRALYRYLRDEGAVYTFASGFGFVSKWDMRTNGWTAVPMAL
jgi:hypothetical protein